MPIQIEAETKQETIDRIKEAAIALLPWNPPAVQTSVKKRNRVMYFLHTLQNFGTELNRRHAQVGAKIIKYGIPALIVFFKWGNKIIAA